MSALYHQFPAFTISGLTIGALYALMAFGYTIVYRILGLFNFAHGGVFMVGTFVALFVARGLGAKAGMGAAGAGVVVVMMLAAAGVCVGLSILLEYGIYRPIRIRRGGGLPALVAGLGALTVMQEVLAKWQGRDPVPVPQPLGDKVVFKLFGGPVQPAHLLVVLVAIAVLVGLHRYVSGTRLGRALSVVGQDEKTASLMGIHVERMVILAFLLAGATAGVAAALFDSYFGSTSYYAGFALGVKGLTASLLGGMGSISGALVGGLVLGVAESYGGAVFGAEWQDVIAFGALILVLFLRPTGIVGQKLAAVRA